MQETIIVRRSERKPTRTTASVRLGPGARFDVIVANLTAEGCCLIGDYLGLSPGQPVGVQLPSMESFSAIVCWSNDTMAGVEFIRPLYGPVADHLAATFRP